MNAKGLSLVEVVIALAIIAVFLTGITYVFAVGLNAVDRDKIKFSAHNLAKDMLEEVLSKKRLEGSTFGRKPGSRVQGQRQRRFTMTWMITMVMGRLRLRPLMVL